MPALSQRRARCRGAGRLALAALVGALALGGCDFAYPEVVIVNQTAKSIQLRHPSFNGCAWDAVLAFGETSVVGRCLPGADRVHFEKLDGVPVDTAPTWFAYQTISVQSVDYGEFHVFVITLDDLEQDFSVPGPYGH